VEHGIFVSESDNAGLVLKNSLDGIRGQFPEGCSAGFTSASSAASVTVNDGMALV